jgi:hypothetical protein
MRRRLVVVTLVALSAAACSSHGTTPRRSAEPPASSPPVTPLSPSPVSPAATEISSPSPVATAAAPIVCAAADLTLSVVQADSGAGQSHQQLVLRNHGRTCTLHGYPGVSFVDAAGHLMGSPAAESPATVRRVTLVHRAAAAALLTYSNAEAFADSTCRPEQASRVRLYPPGSKASLLAADAIAVCTATHSGQLHIGAVEPYGG